MSKKRKYYAVRNTNQIFENWSDCERVVKGTKGVEFKSFPTREQADAYLRDEEPVLSTKKTSEVVPYVSDTGIKGTIKMAEDSDPLLWGIDGFVYSIDGSFNTQTQTYGGAFACYENGVLLDAQAVANNKPQFAGSRNVAGEVCLIMSEKQAKYTKKDFQVGQTVYIEQNAASSAYMVDTVGKIKEEVVEKVGTTYVTTSSQNRYRYEDGLIADAYSKDYCLHLTREQAEISALTRKLKRTILVKTKLSLLETLTLDELQTIGSILTNAEERANGGD